MSGEQPATPPPPPLVSPQSSSPICFRLPRRAAPKSKIGSVDDIAVNLNRVLALSWLDSEFVLEVLRRERQEFAEELQRRKIRTLMSVRSRINLDIDLSPSDAASRSLSSRFRVGN